MTLPNIQRQKVAIIGADPAAFHIFNMIYRNDERCEVQFFIDTEVGTKKVPKYPHKFAGPVYESSININAFNKFQNHLTKVSVEKCVLSPHLFVEGNYLNVTAMCLSVGCTTISHPFEATQISPPKALISLFGDTQFFPIVVNKIINIYRNKGAKPAVVIPMPNHFLFQMDPPVPYITASNEDSLSEMKSNFEDQEYYLCMDIIKTGVPIIFVMDFVEFNKEMLRDDTYDLIFFVGYNTMPIYFSSHFTVYVCDDFTFPECPDEHPSASILPTSDCILFCRMTDDNSVENLRNFTSTPIVEIPVKYNAKNMNCYAARNVITVDDPYPIRMCSAARSMSLWIAEKYLMKPVDISNLIPKNEESLLFEPMSSEKASLAYPILESDYANFNKLLERAPKFDVIVSTTFRPTQIQSSIPLMQFSFDIDVSPITTDVIKLPPNFTRAWSKK